MVHMLIQWVIWHKCFITPTTLLPCGYARANRAANVPNSAKTNSSGIAWRPLAENRYTPSVQRLYYSTYWYISNPQLFIPIEKDIHNHILLAAQRYTYSSKPPGTPWGQSHSHSLLAMHESSVYSVQTFWQHSCIPRAWFPTSSDIPIRPHPLRQRDDTETPPIAKGDAFEKHFNTKKKPHTR